MSEAISKAKTPFRQYARQTFTDAGCTLLFQEEVYAPFIEKERPFRFGCRTLALLMLPAAIAIGIGIALNLLTLPRADLLQEQFFTFITQSTTYQFAVNQVFAFEGIFNIIYSFIIGIIVSFR